MTENSNSQEIKQEITIFAEPVFHVGSFTITNSLLNSFLAVILLVVFFVAISRKMEKVPKGIQNVFEFLLESALDFADSITGDRKKTKKLLPVCLTLFLFILVNNWLGLLPFVGSIGFVEKMHGENIFIPMFRGGTADLNTTLALALFSVVAIHAFGAFTVGVWNYVNRFINIKAFLEIPKKMKKDKNIILVNPIKSFVSIIEIVGEAAKVASLSLRLFGNIFAGEVLLVSMMSIFAFLIPIPFMFLEIIVGLVQAMVFSILVLVFMSMATSAEEH
jgi:F-type H+-transporting ATPase subunit a